MSKEEKKPCIQKRIKMGLSKIISDPLLFLIFCHVIFGLPSFLYLKYLVVLDYSKVRDLVQFIVMADTSVIAFTGVIASMILKYILETLKSRTGSVVLIHFKNKRDNIIFYVVFTLLSLFLSIFFSLIAIIMQDSTQIILSLIFLFDGFIELIAMIVYSLMD